VPPPRPPDYPRTQHAYTQYLSLRAAVDAGITTPAQAHTILGSLTVPGADGIIWALDFDTGTWQCTRPDPPAHTRTAATTAPAAHNPAQDAAGPDASSIHPASPQTNSTARLGQASWPPAHTDTTPSPGAGEWFPPPPLAELNGFTHPAGAGSPAGGDELADSLKQAVEAAGLPAEFLDALGGPVSHAAAGQPPTSSNVPATRHGSLADTSPAVADHHYAPATPWPTRTRHTPPWLSAKQGSADSHTTSAVTTPSPAAGRGRWTVSRLRQWGRQLPVGLVITVVALIAANTALEQVIGAGTAASSSPSAQATQLPAGHA